jgi:hypothetical protein
MRLKHFRVPGGIEVKTGFEFLTLIAALLFAAPAFANVANPGNGANMPPAPAITYNLGTENTVIDFAPLPVVQGFHTEAAQAAGSRGGLNAQIFWLGLLGALGATMFGTGAMLIAQACGQNKAVAAAAQVVNAVQVPMQSVVGAPAAV